MNQLSAANNGANTVFAIVRNSAGAKGLAALAAERKNVHVLEGDVSDASAMQVRVFFSQTNETPLMKSSTESRDRSV